MNLQNVPVAHAQRVLQVKNTEGEVIAAPVEVWIGVILQTLPPEWRDDVCTQVKAYLVVAKQHERRILTAS